MKWKKVKSGTCKGMWSIKATEYFKIINPKYAILKIIPDTSIRNYNSEAIARVICNMYSIPIDRISFKNFHFTYKLPNKVAFFIDISCKKVDFLIITPDEYERIITEKCTSTWPKSTIQKIDTIPMFSPKAIKHEMIYRKEDALSLNVDRKSNEPLNSILNVLDIMESDDRVGVFYNFMPANQMSWRNKHRDSLDKVKKNIPIDKEKLNIGYIIRLLVEEMMKLFVTVFDQVADFIGGGGKNVTSDERAISSVGIHAFQRLSNSTLRKGDKSILDTQIMLLSDSQDGTRMHNNIVAIGESYKTLSEDNALLYKPIKNDFDYEKYKIKKVAVNKLSTEECTNLLQIPGRELLQRHKMIEKVDVLEVQIPDELSHGYISLGEAIFKGQRKTAYLRDEYNQGNLPLVVMGPQSAGKTTYFSNYAVNAHSRGESVIVVDFIKNCELAGAIESVIPKKDLCVLDLSKADNLQGLGYNEIRFTDGMSDFEKLDLANLQAQQVMSLIDSINSEGLPLTSKMRRYLSSAANIVFLKERSNIREVVNCLQDYRKRAVFIESIPITLKEQLEDEINALHELDEVTITKDKDTKETYQEVTGTKDSKIDGILDRINLLKEDMKLKYMFNKKLDGNIDIVDEVENGKIILIKMPEIKFPLPYVKNVIVTYFVTKIWLMLQIRGARYEKPKRCHIILDEIFQAPTCERILREVLPQSRKFGGKFVFSCHYLSQIDTISEALKASGSSFMLLQGTDKKNYDEFKEELAPYELEDLLNLKQYHSLNLIKYEKGYAKFITHLPAPIK